MLKFEKVPKESPTSLPKEKRGNAPAIVTNENFVS